MSSRFPLNHHNNIQIYKQIYKSLSKSYFWALLFLDFIYTCLKHMRRITRKMCLMHILGVKIMYFYQEVKILLFSSNLLLFFISTFHSTPFYIKVHIETSKAFFSFLITHSYLSIGYYQVLLEQDILSFLELKHQSFLFIRLSNLINSNNE